MSCIFMLFFHVQIFFWFNFRYVAKPFYIKIGKSSNSALLVVQMLFWNRWNQEAAGRVYFNICREKSTHTPDTPHVQPLSAKLEWTNQKHFYCFLLKAIKDSLAPGFARALDLSPLHAQKSSGSWLFLTGSKRSVHGSSTQYFTFKNRKSQVTLLFSFSCLNFIVLQD